MPARPQTPLAYEAFGVTAPAKAPSPPALATDLADGADGAIPADGAGPSPLAWTPSVPRWQRALYFLLAIGFATAFFLVTHVYWTPAHPGVDQNGYLVGGRLIAQTGSPAIHPGGDDYLFVGRMWIGADIGTPAERYYPKYPLGLPLWVAAAWKIAGPVGAYWISPLSMAGAVLGCYLLFRQAVAPYSALLGMILIATSPVTAALANNPNSHAATFFCVAWGMFFLLSWWRRGRLWRAGLAGLLIGYAATIRYTEGLLVLPMLLTALFAMRWRNGRSYLHVMAMFMMWALPIGLLLAYNRHAFGAWTGYDPTRESTGFGWDYFQDNYAVMIRQLTDTALFFILPLGVLGLPALLRRRFRLAMVLLAWLLPGLLLYTAYYWAPDGNGIGYTRFFLTVLPPLVLGAVWLVEHVIQPDPETISNSFWRNGLRRTLAPLPLGILVGITLLIQVNAATGELESNFRGGLIAQSGADSVLAHAPVGSVVFADDRLLHHLQFVGDYRLYNFDPFNRQGVQRWKIPDGDQPNPLQSQRVEKLYDLLKDKTERQLVDSFNSRVLADLTAGRRVFIALPKAVYDRQYKKMIGKGLRANEIDSWTEPDDLRVVRRMRWQPRPDRPAPVRRPTGWVLVELMAG